MTRVFDLEMNEIVDGEIRNILKIMIPYTMLKDKRMTVLLKKVVEENIKREESEK